MAFGDIVLLKDQTAHGPYTRGQILEGLSRGDFSARDLAHTPGLKDWLPLIEVLHHVDREPVHAPRAREQRILPPLPSMPGTDAPAVSPPVVASAPSNPTSFAPRDLPPVPAEKAEPPPFASDLPSQLPDEKKSGAFSPVLETSAPRPSKPPTLPQAAPPLPARNPAPMRQRCLAWAIDWAVLFLPVLIVFAFAYVVWLIKGPLEHRDAETARQEQALLWRNLRDLVFMVAIGFAWIYAAVLESSRWQGTVGKQCMGLIVTDESGQRLSFLHATGRHAAKYLSAVPLFLGFMAALFNPQRLTWHDRLAGTRVVER
jgi:uncharacterized RDD family membrane protein YckC